MLQVAKVGELTQMVPGSVHPEFTRPTMVEQHMIARVHPVYKVYPKAGG